MIHNGLGAVEHAMFTHSDILPPLQIIGHLTFFTQVCPLILFKNVCKISLLLLWFALSIQVLREWLNFDYVCTNFLNKTSGQIWGQKSQTTYNWERSEYIAELVTMGIVNLNHLCSFLLEDYTQHTTPGNPQCYATRKSCSVFSEIEYYLIKISCSWFAHAGPEQRSTSEQQRGFGKVSPLQVHSLVYLFLS